MKKYILASALALSLFGFSAMAQDANTSKSSDQDKCPKTEQMSKKGHKGPRFNEFEGITLTADQQAKIDQLRANRRQAKADLKKERADMRASRDSMAKAKKIEYIHEMKEILSPDQYVVYLENIVVNAPGQPRQKMAGAKVDKDRKAMDGARKMDRRPSDRVKDAK